MFSIVFGHHGYIVVAIFNIPVVNMLIQEGVDSQSAKFKTPNQFSIRIPLYACLFSPFFPHKVSSENSL